MHIGNIKIEREIPVIIRVLIDDKNCQKQQIK